MANASFDGGLFPIWLQYEGRDADHHLIDLYDFSVALRGFERGLALTSHFVLNNEIITQVTAVRGVKILCSPPEVGSLRIPAYLAATGLAVHSIGSLEPNNPIGHLIFSFYDLAVHEATGQPLDYTKSLREIYETALERGSEGLLIPSRTQFDSLVEKVEPSIAEVHRPIVGSGTAISGFINDSEALSRGGQKLLLNEKTHASLRYRSRSKELIPIVGRVSSFNMNTFNGRFVMEDTARPIPFFLTPAGRAEKSVRLIGESLAENIRDRNSNSSIILFDCFLEQTRTGRISKLVVGGVRPVE